MPSVLGVILLSSFQGSCTSSPRRPMTCDKAGEQEEEEVEEEEEEEEDEEEE